MNKNWRGWQLSEFKQNTSSWVRYDYITKINYIYVNIPKNASSWMRNNFGGHSYNFRNNTLVNYLPGDSEHEFILQNPTPPTYVLILRDPISRWLSGSAQAFFNCPPDSLDFFMNWSDELIFNTIAFDEHTAPQTMFLKDVDLSQVVWFDCTDNLADQLAEWSQGKFNITPIPASDYKYNDYKISKLDKPQGPLSNPLNWTPMQCIDALQHRLYSSLKHIEKVKNFYKTDYELRESVKFYGTI
jgi:hypothetical protein